MPETLRDQQLLFAALRRMLFCREPERIAPAGQATIDALAAGSLRGTNPANPAERHNAVMMEAWRIRNAGFGLQTGTKRKARDARVPEKARG